MCRTQIVFQPLAAPASRRCRAARCPAGWRAAGIRCAERERRDARGRDQAFEAHLRAPTSSAKSAKPRSLSTISTTRSSGWIASRSSLPRASRGRAVRRRAHPWAIVRHRQSHRRRLLARARCERRDAPRRLLRHERLRQIERELAAHVRRADQPDLAAQQPGRFAADRQAQAGAAVLAARCCRRPAETPRR